MTEAAYFNVHGQPISVSARDAVIASEPYAYSKVHEVTRLSTNRSEELWQIHRGRADGKRRYTDRLLGDGATEESAWRNTWSRILAEEVAKEVRP